MLGEGFEESTTVISRALPTAFAVAAMRLVACTSDNGGPLSDGGADDTASVLRWYTTCGDPVCRVPNDASASDSGVSPCSNGEAVGLSCTNRGSSCGDPDHNCGSVLLCTDHDPKAAGCPISSRRLKDDIVYVSPVDLERLRQDMLGIRLATFRYKHGDGKRHLGYILEDSPTVFASDMARSQVDLYAYTSMAVAALQIQTRRIEQLEADVDALSNEVEAITGRRPPLSTLSCAPRPIAAPASSGEIACR
jgi:hypothetical protein